VQEKLNDIPVVVYYFNHLAKNQDRSIGFVWIVPEIGGNYRREDLDYRMEELIVILKAFLLQLEKYLKRDLPGLENKKQMNSFFQ
jgi:hypothetical protein